MVAILSRKFVQGLYNCIPCPFYNCLPIQNRLICENSPRYYHQFVVGFGQRLIFPPKKGARIPCLGPGPHPLSSMQRTDMKSLLTFGK